jgi:hypothetical protein
LDTFFIFLEDSMVALDVVYADGTPLVDMSL